MLDQLVISGNVLILFTIWIGLIVLFQASKVLSPNWKLKQYVSLKAKLPNDSWTRFFGMLWFSFWVYVILYILEIVK